MKITQEDFDKFELRDFSDFIEYFNYIQKNMNRLVAHEWNSREQFGRAIFRKLP
jgi:hypothetical protein